MKQSIRSRNMLLWLLVFALVIACVPSSMVVQVPTLDPHAINTYIAQTADAAILRTASVPTLTATSTLASTFTPEPTYTSVAPYAFPTLEITDIRYFRVKHDHQLERYGHRSRTAAGDWQAGPQTPEVVRMFKLPSLKSEAIRTEVDGPWEVFIDSLNNHEVRKLRYLKAANTALFDHKGFPHLESLTMGGNVVTLNEISGAWGRIRTLSLNSPINAKELNYFTAPDLIHKFVVVGWNKNNESTFLINPPPGDIYWPLVASRPIWLEMELLEPFPTLPASIVVKEVQPVYSEPDLEDSVVRGSLRLNETVTIIDYRPSASNVWGKLLSGNWVLLFTYKKGVPHYSTSWSMATLPPIPPAPEPKK